MFPPRAKLRCDWDWWRWTRWSARWPGQLRIPRPAAGLSRSRQFGWRRRVLARHGTETLQLAPLLLVQHHSQLETHLRERARQVGAGSDQALDGLVGLLLIHRIAIELFLEIYFSLRNLGANVDQMHPELLHSAVDLLFLRLAEVQVLDDRLGPPGV